MNAERLLALFERVADAPDAIPRLRRFVLDLAVRGKLVEQDPGDEAAGVRLAAARRNIKVMAETARRVRWKPSEPISESEIDKAVPAGWVAARVNDTALYVNGLAFKPTDWKPDGVPIIRIQNLTDRTREFNHARGDFPDEITVRDGDLLVSWSATLEAFKWNRGEGVLNQHIFRVMPDGGLTDRDYLLLLLRRAIREIAESEHARGLVMTHFNRGPFLNHVVLIPPIAEQRRIVAMMDELTGLIDQLEVSEGHLAERRRHVADSTRKRPAGPGSLARSTENGGVSAAGMLRALGNHPANIERIRRYILDSAVNGKLAARDDYSRRRVGEFRQLQNGYAFKSEWFGTSGVRLLRNVNVGHGHVRWDETALLPEVMVAPFERFHLGEGDVVLSLDRPFISTGVKVARISASDLPAMLVQRVGRFVETQPGLTDEYLQMWIRSSGFSEQVDPGRSNGVPHISSKQVERTWMFLPPAAEQLQVVAKVTALMGLCDRLETALIVADSAKQRLLETLIYEALEGDACVEEAVLHDGPQRLRRVRRLAPALTGR